MQKKNGEPKQHWSSRINREYDEYRYRRQKETCVDLRISPCSRPSVFGINTWLYGAVFLEKPTIGSFSWDPYLHCHIQCSTLDFILALTNPNDIFKIHSNKILQQRLGLTSSVFPYGIQNKRRYPFHTTQMRPIPPHSIHLHDTIIASPWANYRFTGTFIAIEAHFGGKKSHVHPRRLILTSQWLKTSCGLAKPDVCLRISGANWKLSTTGRTAVTAKLLEPSCMSPWSTRPWRRPSTAYILPVNRIGHSVFLPHISFLSKRDA